MTVGNRISYLGGYNAAPPLFNGWGGSLANVGMFYGQFPSSGATPSTTALASLCKKSTDFQSFATANGVTVHSLYRLNDPGIWGDSGLADFTGSIAGSALTIVSTQSGSAAALPAGTVISGNGISGCPSACPTVTAGSGSAYTLSGSSTVAAEPMKAGAYKPASPAVNNGFNGYIAGSTLTVTSIASANQATFTGSLNYPSATFSGSIPNGSNVLTITGNTSPSTLALVGSVISGTSIPANTYITANGTGTGNAGTYDLNWTNTTGSAITETMTIAQAMSPASVFLSPTALTVSGVTGTITSGMLVTDGGASIGGTPLLITGGSGTAWTVAPNYYPTISSDATMTAVSTSLVPGHYVLGSSVTTPIKIIGYGANTPGLCTSGAYGCGTYTILNPAALTIGSLGSPAAFTATGASDGGAVAPGPALTIKDPGPGLTFPVTNTGASTGALWLSGTYDTGTLGGAPSAIQAQVSYTAGGPAISGCAACAWTNLSSASVSGGNWSGQAINIPAGGPYFVSVRAANGTAYATLPSVVKVGLVFDLWGEGQSAAITAGANGGWANSTYKGLWGVNSPSTGNFYSYDTGPALATNLYPSWTQMLGGNQFSITGGLGETLPEGASSLLQNLQNSMGYPATLSEWVRDGAGLNVFVWGNQVQSQSIGTGNGSTATWCSASNFCSNVGQGGTLDFNLASLTGAAFPASISGTTLTVGAITSGALQPGAVLSGAGITGSPTLVACTSNCAAANLISGGSGSVWTISASEGTIGSEAMRADPSGGAPAPYYNPAAYSLAQTTYGYSLIKAGTFSLSVNGAVACTDSNTAVYNVMGGNCAGAGVSSSFVNYATGDYQVTFSTPPANNAVITASWKEIISPDGSNLVNVYNNLDYVGDGTATGGFLSSVYSRTPGGVSGHIYAATSSDVYQFYNNGYPLGGVGQTQMISWFYGTKIPGIFNGGSGVPYMSPSTPFISASVWRADGPEYFQGPNIRNLSQDHLGEDWSSAVATKSLFSGTIASNVLTLTSAATGPMWEGEIVSCATFSLTCAVTPGAYITSLASGTWGANGSTYNLGGSPANVASATAMGNGLYYQGAGVPIYAGSGSDNSVMQPPGGVNGTDGISAHPSMGFTGGRRIASRWAALIYGGLTSASNASEPTLDRTKADAGGCDAASIAGPCFDVGSTYAASASATWTGSVATVTGGLSAHARPFVVGQALSCSGCNANLVITALDVPPTQSAGAGLGEVGQTFHITASGTIGGSGSGTLTGSC